MNHEKKTIFEDPLIASESHVNDCLTPRNSCTPMEIPPGSKSHHSANTRHLEPLLDEGRLWANYADLLSSLPDQSKAAVQLGILEEYILAGIRAGKDLSVLFLLASLGISIANNDRTFYEDVRKAIEK